jgi:hypothetical protein
MVYEFGRSIGVLENYMGPLDLAQKELDELPEDVRKKVKVVMTTSYKCADDVSRACDDVLKDIPESIAPLVKTEMYTRHGTEQESGIREIANAIRYKTGEKAFRTSSNFKRSAAPMLTVDGLDVYVGGRHDGMAGTQLVEIKTRQRKFLGTPVYELVQVHAYMFIYGTRNALFIESLNGDIREHTVEFDDGLWGKVREGIATYQGRCAALASPNPRT